MTTFQRRVVRVAPVIGLLCLAQWRHAATAGSQTPSNAVQQAPAGQRLAGRPGEKGSDLLRPRSADHASDDEVPGRACGGDRARAHRRRDDHPPRSGGQRAGAAASEPDRCGARHGALRAERRRAVSGCSAIRRPSGRRSTGSTRQAYGLAKDGTANLVWDDGTMRPKGAARTDVDSGRRRGRNGVGERPGREADAADVYSRREIAPGRLVRRAGAGLRTDPARRAGRDGPCGSSRIRCSRTRCPV